MFPGQAPKYSTQLWPFLQMWGSVLLIRLHPLSMQAGVSMSSPPFNSPPNQWPPPASAQAERPVDQTVPQRLREVPRPPSPSQWTCPHLPKAPLALPQKPWDALRAPRAISSLTQILQPSGCQGLGETTQSPTLPNCYIAESLPLALPASISTHLSTQDSSDIRIPRSRSVLPFPTPGVN